MERDLAGQPRTSPSRIQNNPNSTGRQEENTSMDILVRQVGELRRDVVDIAKNDKALSVCFILLVLDMVSFFKFTKQIFIPFTIMLFIATLVRYIMKEDKAEVKKEFKERMDEKIETITGQQKVVGHVEKSTENQDTKF